MLEFREEDVGVHAIGNPKQKREDVERVYVFPAGAERLGRGSLLYGLPPVYRSRDSYSIRTFVRRLKVDGLELSFDVVVVRRRVGVKRHS